MIKSKLEQNYLDELQAVSFCLLQSSVWALDAPKAKNAIVVTYSGLMSY